MPRPKGLPKTGGRKPGTPNKRTTILSEILDTLGCDVPKTLVELLPRLDPAKQADILLELMDFLYPKRKAVELTGQNGGAIEVNDLRGDLAKILADPQAIEAAQVIAERMAANGQ